MAKVKTTSINRKKISWLLEQDLSIKLEALQHHLDISRMLVNDILEDEVISYSGIRYSHDKPNNGRYSRWGLIRVVSRSVIRGYLWKYRGYMIITTNATNH